MHAVIYGNHSYFFIFEIRSIEKLDLTVSEFDITALFLYFAFSLLSCFLNDDSDQIELTGLYYVNKTIKLLNT